MAKIKLTKNELKKQRDSLKMYRRYLPTLQLKKQQLQSEIRSIELRQRELAKAKEALQVGFDSWISVFGEQGVAFDVDGQTLVDIQELKIEMGNIAGVDIPIFRGASFRLRPYDTFSRPLWIDQALRRLSDMSLFDLEIRVLDEQIARLGKELRVTTQRVNLFEKVKIPGTQAAIKKIGIYLGDQQTAQVVRGKIAKSNLERGQA